MRSGEEIETAFVRRLDARAQLPRRMTAHAAGHDLFACLDAPLELLPGGRVAVSTGLSMALPQGHEAQVRPRSGWAWKHGVTVLNAPGTIDADYRGELKVLLINHGAQPFTVEHGDRIAQLVLSAVVPIHFSERDDLPEPSAQGGAAVREGGFGSTGRR
ncbi:MAG: dUTP diphosphatase [Nannocystaceae bacterium]|nr:dUTP diphosphatase [Nannocystaceae bacterium]